MKPRETLKKISHARPKEGENFALPLSDKLTPRDTKRVLRLCFTSQKIFPAATSRRIFLPLEDNSGASLVDDFPKNLTPQSIGHGKVLVASRLPLSLPSRNFREDIDPQGSRQNRVARLLGTPPPEYRVRLRGALLAARL